MARQRTGQLIKRASGYYARVSTIVDGERVRVMRALGTHSLPAARRKIERLLAEGNPAAADVSAGETFEQAAERVYKARIAEASGKGPRQELANLRAHAFEHIGPMQVTAIKPTDVNVVLDGGKASGLSRQSVQHLRQRVSNVFAALQREGVITSNPVSGSAMPRFADTRTKERAVLTDAELAVYLAWEPAPLPKQKEKALERRRAAARELQTMCCVARMFGGLRTGDLHALQWEAFDVELGAFTWGYAPRQKTRRPQLLEVPEMLRPILRDHWERAGRPQAGLVFPVRRVGRLGDRIGKERKHVSHAARFRRDLQRAFKAAAARDVEAPKEGSQRWRELFSDAEPYTLPVDFHSWRRAFVQALADADVNAQQAQALAGHADLGAHARYLRNAGKMRQLPAAALPDLRVMKALPADTEAERALALGSESAQGAERPVNRAGHVEAPVPDFPAVPPGDPLPMLQVVSSNLIARSEQVAETTAEAAESDAGAAEAKGTDAAFSVDPIEAALAEALKGATAAGQWSTVAELARELEGRRQARAGTVDLAAARKRRGRP